MNFIKEIKNNGKIPTYHLEDEIKLLAMLDRNKPSTRIIRTKKGRKAIAALKNIEKNHNNSWYQELVKISSNAQNELALFYRGKYITFGEMFEEADKLANSLAKMGIKQGDEIPACLANVPETVYFLLAANKIGAKVNLFGSHVDKIYLNQILDDCTDKVFFATDDYYGDIKDVIQNRNFQNKVVISLADSLPEDPTITEEYEPELDKYYHYENKSKQFKNIDNSIMTYDECIQYGQDYDKEILDDNTLETEFLITYTSGSTKVGFPKAIIHTNRSLITSGIFHSPELTGNPRIDGLRGLAHIHTDSNTDVITCISDNLMQLWSTALEPEYGRDTFLDILFINKPNYCNATKSHIVAASKQYLIDKKFNNRKMPFLLALFAVGEGTSKGEEKLANMFLRKSRAGSGVKISGVSLPYVTLSIGGGDTEHGGIYYSLWKKLFENLYSFKLRKEEYGMAPVPYAQVTALKINIDGSYSECDYNELGLIVSNSATTTKGYKNNKEATKKLIVRDDMGRDWVSNNVYGYIDDLGTVHVKDRYENKIVFSDGTIIPNFKIEEVVLKDTKNILSCSVTQGYTEDGESVPVINIEFQPFKQKSNSQIIDSMRNRIISELPMQVINNCVIRIFNNKDSFPLTGSGKRSIAAIENMGLDFTSKLTLQQFDYETFHELKGVVKKLSR